MALDGESIARISLTSSSSSLDDAVERACLLEEEDDADAKND